MLGLASDAVAEPPFPTSAIIVNGVPENLGGGLQAATSDARVATGMNTPSPSRSIITMQTVSAVHVAVPAMGGEFCGAEGAYGGVVGIGEREGGGICGGGEGCATAEGGAIGDEGGATAAGEVSIGGGVSVAGGVRTASSLVAGGGEGATVMMDVRGTVTVEVTVTWTVWGASCVVSSGVRAACVVSSGAGGAWAAAPFGAKETEWWAVMVVVRVTRVVLVRVVTTSVVCSGGDIGAGAAVARLESETVGASHSLADPSVAGVGTVERVASDGLLGGTIAVYIAVSELSLGPAGIFASGGSLGDTIAVNTSEPFADTEFTMFPPQLKSSILD